MKPSLPCPCCGRVDDLDRIDPSGIMMGVLVQWECPCGNTRTVRREHVAGYVVRAAEAKMDTPDRARKAGAI